MKIWKPYKRLFDESFESQKAIYQIVDNILEKIQKPFRDAFQHFFVDNKDTEFKFSYGNFRKPEYKIDLILRATFNMKTLFRLIEDSDLLDSREYRFLSSFYEKRPQATLTFEFYLKKQGNTFAYYDPIKKDINCILVDKNVMDKIPDVKYMITNLFYYNKAQEHLVHEFTHLYDDVISQERAITQKINKYVSADSSVEGYLQQDIELNARFYSAAYKALEHKLQCLTSQAGLKRIWNRNYFPVIEQEIAWRYITKDQQVKITKRAWNEFTTLSKYENALLIEKSIQVMVNNGDIKQVDIRLSNKIEPAKKLKQYFVDLKNKKISSNLFRDIEPLMNDEFQKGEYSEIKMNKQILKNIKWQEAENFYAIYKLIEKYGKNNYSAELIDNVLKSLRLPESIVEDIKQNYNIY
jgi:hypothetical protein